MTTSSGAPAEFENHEFIATQQTLSPLDLLTSRRTRLQRKFFFTCLYVLIVLAASLSAQTDLAKLYRSAQAASNDSPSRTRLRIPLRGVWEARASQPKLEAQVALPGAYYFEGEVKFERKFQIADSLRGRTLRLHALGVNHEARLAFNNEIAATHLGGYTAFTVDLNNEVVRYGQDNTISLTVDNRLAPLHTLPPKHRPLGWRNAGGVLRDIYLEALPLVAIDNFTTRATTANGAAQIALQAQLRSSRTLAPESLNGIIAEFEIWDTARKTKVAASTPIALSSWREFRHELALNCNLPNASLWSPESPSLYHLRLVLTQNKKVVDELWQETGFRRIEISGKELRLNNAPFALRGVDWHEDYGQESAALDTAKLAQLLATLQQLGVNALRVVGHQPHPLLPALCDRAGIFLLEDMPLYYLTDAHFQHPRFAAMAQLLAREMQERDRHHPSVLAWGLGVNAAPISPAAQEEIAALVNAMRQIDERPLYVVTAPEWQSLWTTHADFMLMEWRAAMNLEALSTTLTGASKLVVPVLGHYVSTREAGSGARIEPARAEELQAEYFNRMLPALKNAHASAGYFVHTLQDWQAPMPLLALGPPLESAPHTLGAEQAKDWGKFYWTPGSRAHSYGLIEASGRRRMAFQIVQRFNRGDGNPTLVARRPATSPPGTFQIVGIALILFFLFFLQRDRRLLSNLKRVLAHPHGFFLDLYENRKVAPFLTLMLGLTESCILAVLLAQFGYAFRQSLIFDQLLNLLLDDAAWKAIAIRLIWNPGWFIFWGALFTFCAGLVLALFFRILGVFFGSGATLSQYVAAVYWSWANVLFLGLLTPIFHRLLLNESLFGPLTLVIALVLLWQWFRMFRAFHVLYMVSYFRAFLVFVFVFGGLLTTLVLYLDRTRALFQYVPYYLALWQGVN